MECFNCTRHVDHNAFADVSDLVYDSCVDWYGLIALRGPEDQFDENGLVVLCEDCIEMGIA